MSSGLDTSAPEVRRNQPLLPLPRPLATSTTRQSFFAAAPGNLTPWYDLAGHESEAPENGSVKLSSIKSLHAHLLLDHLHARNVAAHKSVSDAFEMYATGALSLARLAKRVFSVLELADMSDAYEQFKQLLPKEWRAMDLEGIFRASIYSGVLRRSGPQGTDLSTHLYGRHDAFNLGRCQELVNNTVASNPSASVKCIDPRTLDRTNTYSRPQPFRIPNLSIIHRRTPLLTLEMRRPCSVSTAAFFKYRRLPSQLLGEWLKFVLSCANISPKAAINNSIDHTKSAVSLAQNERKRPLPGAIGSETSEETASKRPKLQTHRHTDAPARLAQRISPSKPPSITLVSTCAGDARIIETHPQIGNHDSLSGRPRRSTPELAERSVDKGLGNIDRPAATCDSARKRVNEYKTTAPTATQAVNSNEASPGLAKAASSLPHIDTKANRASQSSEPVVLGKPQSHDHFTKAPALHRGSGENKHKLSEKEATICVRHVKAVPRNAYRGGKRVRRSDGDQLRRKALLCQTKITSSLLRTKIGGRGMQVFVVEEGRKG